MSEEAMNRMKDNVLRWFGIGRVGSSSKAMALHLCGVPCDDSHPLDPDDFNRCLLFLEAVPEARALLPQMATLNAYWAALIERWHDIETCFLDEVGLDWCNSPRLGAFRTGRLMADIERGVRERWARESK